MIDPDLFAILVCPVDRGHLREDVESAQLVCERCGRGYPVVDGIPVMLAQDLEENTDG